MAELKIKGLSYESIATLFGVSRQRVHQILSGYKKLNHSGQHKKGWYGKLKELVLARDDDKCQRCDSTKSLIVHHHSGDDNDNNLSNLITLCRKCHQKIHNPGKRR